MKEIGMTTDLNEQRLYPHSRSSFNIQKNEAQEVIVLARYLKECEDAGGKK
jgi:hypothetical protein